MADQTMVRSRKERDRQAWNTVAPGWERHADILTFPDISEEMCSQANLKSGNSVLDVATGFGEPALTATRYVMPHGHVLGVDQAHNMIEIANRRKGKSAEEKRSAGDFIC